ncbi:PH domain protein [Aspergillus saccharolyticus JOP 1030-1]|uniref:PH domain protein n=1 Tax=Aspergillus saccharolyticus JOP 1030-1 TaxID=1450539 RepID=A0A318ZTR1_9EURO|nr:PH domain protein [Aspergillus saccharolyticus JOP 1030-1]PYH50064.1 PH domain protein [Aspergillus saccharolyticus JOP 1030-1]
MGRSRVLSLMSVFGGSSRKDNPGQHHRTASASVTLNNPPFRTDPPTPDTASPIDASPISGTSNAERRISSRPDSTYFSHNPPLVEFSQDTPPELQPIFSHLNSHANKLYHEGYFLKLNDLDIHGRPSSDRQWVECYAQLVGTALSLWDAAALDEAGDDGDVRPTFINLADASIKMLETLPTRNQQVKSLKNILSICSAGQNRYLLHFNSFHSLTQWTAAIRLALFEHTSLYEAYTGSIIAGKGKTLNNVKHILERNRFKHEDWARVRFGAGTPWRRCWFVVTPPNEKEFQKAQKSIKKSAYDRAPRLVTGHIKFYETKKTKKATPIATITDAYAAFAIYPQSKPLIEQSTLVKIEGTITVHSQPESTSEGFVFVMPEVHPAVSGFEMMLRFLIPTFDTFNLYGRPTRLLAATNHIKSIMFAFPNRRRYGYLDILDISSLMQTPGSQNWSEAEWRKQLKEATARRMATAGSRTSSVSGSKPRFRSSLPSRQGNNVRAGATQRIPSSPEHRQGYNQSTDAIVPEVAESDPVSPAHHARGASDFTGLASQTQASVSLSESSPPSSAHDLAPSDERPRGSDRSSGEAEPHAHAELAAEAVGQQLRPVSPPSPVVQPPAFTHGPGEVPPTRPRASPDLRKVNNRMSDATLTQLVAASGGLSRLGSDLAAHSQTTAGETSQPSPPTPSSETVEHYADWVNPEAIGRSNTLQQSSLIDPRSNAFGPPLAIPKARGLRLDTAKAVKRKPVPQQYAGEPDSSSAAGEPSFDDLRHTVDEEALNWVGNRQLSFTSRDQDSRPDEDSVYDDESAASPDYASTRGSVYSKRSVKSIPRPRMGVKKTVGTVPDTKDFVIGDAHYSIEQSSEPKSTADIPTIDFGPTMTLMPTTARPTTSETFKKSGHGRSESNSTEKQGPTPHMERSHSRSPSMMWQPGMAAPRPTTPGRLTPEQFVQQRSAPSPPLHAHHRTLSSSATTNLAPALPRPLSGDWTGGSRLQPQSSGHREGPARPQSRGASTVMNYNELSSHLSAREQEHISRMTGAPLLDFPGGHKPQVTPVNPMGLVGAIDAREREKKNIREGVSNQMVQHAIAQRQQHWQQQQQQQPPTPAQTQPQLYGQDNHYSVYNLPAASRTWDALNQPYHPEEPRRQSWYGQYFAAQKSRTPPVHHHTQSLGQPTGYFGNANASHY